MTRSPSAAPPPPSQKLQQVPQHNPLLLLLLLRSQKVQQVPLQKKNDKKSLPSLQKTEQALDTMGLEKYSDAVTVVSELTLLDAWRNVGKEVLVFSGDHLHPAKVVDTRASAGSLGTDYFVHYVGYNRRHDAWKLSCQLLPAKGQTSRLVNGHIRTVMKARRIACLHEARRDGVVCPDGAM
jgi:hypothetical protein